MGDIITGSGAKLYVSDNAYTSTAMDSLAEFRTVSNWIEVGNIQTIGGFGDEASEVTFTALGDSRVKKAKGARNAGTSAVTVGHDPEDAGQTQMEAAEATNDNYAFKVVIQDGPTPAYTDSIYYFRGLVMSKRFGDITNDGVVMKTYNVGINSEVIEDPSTI